MNLSRLCFRWILLAAFSCPGAVAAELRISIPNGNASVQVLGDRDNDWRFQVADDLGKWADVPSLGTLVAGDETNAPTRLVPGWGQEGRGYLRAVRTGGLYDPTLLRTFRLTFTQSNWASLLTAARSAGTDVLCSLESDNGVSLKGVGARYKGNTSFTMGGAKKSLNITINYTNVTSELLGYETFNLNNAAGDETILREPVYFTVMSRYAPSPRAALAQLYINGANWGVYSLAQNGDSDLMKDWFPSADGDRWRAPNIGGGGGGGGGGGFASAGSALAYLGPNLSSYRSNYELRHTTNAALAWNRLTNAIFVLNLNAASSAGYYDKVDQVLATDDWCWFLAVENIFTDDDSYWNKGADYAFYFEPESGRIHPVEHDGNEAFVPGDTSLTPLQGSTGTNRPVIKQFIANPELKQRYLAHMRTVLRESFHPGQLTPLINAFTNLSLAAIAADPKKGYNSMTTYQTDLASLKTFVTNRYRFLTNHLELRRVPPVIQSVSVPPPPVAGAAVTITAEVLAGDSSGVESVWLYHRGAGYGRFTRVHMLDDGLSGDGAAGDQIYGAAIDGYGAGTKVRYYVEARSGNAEHTTAFMPARTERGAFSYRVALARADSTPVRINEVMAHNTTTAADPQGDFDDWIELRNLTGQSLDLTGHYLTDDPDNPRKWPFPAGTGIPAGGYLLVWADEDGAATLGLHANFRLAATGEQVLLVGPDSEGNLLLDAVSFGAQLPDRAWGRPSASPDDFGVLDPTPGAENP